MRTEVPSQIEYRGVRIDLAHFNKTSRLPMLAEAWRGSEGAAAALRTVRSGGVDVSTRPERWPDRVLNYRGPARLEGVGGPVAL